MKFIEVKVFHDQINYFLIIEKINFKNNQKIIEQEFKNEIQDINEVKYYLTSILNNVEYRKYKTFINFISNDVIIEVVNENKTTKTNYLTEINKLYPNYHIDYQLLSSVMKINSENKKRICALVSNQMVKDVNSIISFSGKNKIYLGIDALLLQMFINDNVLYFNKKYIIILQKTFSYYRIYQILNGKIINYIIINENNNNFNNIFTTCLRNIDNKADEVIFEGPYMVYNNLVEKYFMVSITFMDNIDKIRYLDERKIAYGKKKL